MAAKKARKRAYIPPSSEVVNKRERTETTTRTHRSSAPRSKGARATGPVYPPPSLNRTLRKLPLYFIMIFALQYYLLGREANAPEGMKLFVTAGGTAAFVTILFAPFMYMMDRLAYNRYLKRSGQLPAPKPGSGA